MLQCNLHPSIEIPKTLLGILHPLIEIPNDAPEYIFCFLAKHLALHGCRSAYSSQEEAQKAAIPVLQGPDEEDLESFDPNEVMAKAYMAKKQVDEEESTSQTPAQDGPLAFLGRR